MQAQGYGAVVDFDGSSIVIQRNKIMAAQYGFDRTVIPLASVVSANVSKASLFTNGLFCLSIQTESGPTPVIVNAADSRKTPYCAIFTRKHSDEFLQLADAINAAKPVEAMPADDDQSGQTRFAQTERKILASQPYGRKIATFKGSDGTVIVLFEHGIECKGESHPLDGVIASVLNGSDLESRVTATRLLLLGVFAFAFKKRKGGEKYLLVEGPDFAWMAEADRKHVRDAMQFATQVENAVRKL